MEEWKDVKGFEGRFKISNQGKILSINGKFKGERLLNPCIDKEGYYVTELRMNPISRRVRVHSLVAEHFINMPEGLSHPCVNHKDGNKLNNDYTNLEIISKKENCAHAVNTGLHSIKGSKHPNSKMTEESVIKIRELYSLGNTSHSKLGLFFGITREQARDIINRKNWKHI